MTILEGSSRTGQSELKRQCLDRDGGRCVLIGAFDTDRYDKMPPGERKSATHTRTECAHILPFALSKLKEKTAVQVQNKATTWWALYEYFPALRGKIAADTVNQPGNAVTLSAVIHTEFALFTLGFQPTEEVCFYQVYRENHNVTWQC